MSNHQENIYSNEISLKEIVLAFKEWLKYLKSKWKIILLSYIVGAIIGIGYASFKKTSYLATLTFALEDDRNAGGGLNNALGLATSLGLDLGNSAGGAFSGTNLIELMKSRRMIEQALLNPIKYQEENISLAELYIRINGWREKWRKRDSTLFKELQFPANSNRLSFSLHQDSMLGIVYNKLLAENLNVSQKDKKVSIISIDVKSINELFSKSFAEAIVREVSNFYINVKSKKAKINVDILERQADSIRNQLNNAITDVAVANNNTYNLNPALNTPRTPSLKKQIDVQANTVILTEIVKNLELARVTLRKETPLIQIIDTPILPLITDKPDKIFLSISYGMLVVLTTLIALTIKKVTRYT